MKKRKIEQLLQNEGKKIVPDSFSCIMEKLGFDEISSFNATHIENSLKKETNKFVPDMKNAVMASVAFRAKKRFIYSNKFAAIMSSALVGSLALSLAIAIPLTYNPSNQGVPSSAPTTVSYKIVTIDDTATTDVYNPVIASVGPAMNYSIDENGKVVTDSITSLNDPARYLSSMMTVSDSDPLRFNYNIINTSLDMGFIERKTNVSNLVFVSFATASNEYASYLYNKMNEETLKFFKTNYVYGTLLLNSTEKEEEIIDFSKYEGDEDFLALLYKVYELAKVLFTADDGTYVEGFVFVNSDGSLASFDVWVDIFKDWTIEQLNVIYTNFVNIQSKITSDDQKALFLQKLEEAYETYIFNKNCLKERLEDIDANITELKDELRELISPSDPDYKEIDNNDWYFTENEQGGHHHGDNPDWDDDWWDDDWWDWDEDPDNPDEWDDDDWWDWWDDDEDVGGNGHGRNSSSDKSHDDDWFDQKIIDQIKREIRDLLKEYDRIFEKVQKNDKWFYDSFDIITGSTDFSELGLDEWHDNDDNDPPEGWEDGYDWDHWHHGHGW